MSVIDDYLSKLEPDKRKQLERIRTIPLHVVPDAQEVISYGMPYNITANLFWDLTLTQSILASIHTVEKK